MKKKLLAMFMVLVVALTACGQSGTKDNVDTINIAY